MLLLIAGDGIRENVGAITNFIEGHGTMHFTFGLVEMAIYRMPDDRHLVQPRVLAHSEIIRRITVNVHGSEFDYSDTESEDEAQDSIPRPDLEERRHKYKTFWTEWLEKYPLYDQSQPVNAPTTGKIQTFHMPKESKLRVVASVAEGIDKAGVYISFLREPVHDRIYTALLADRAAIDEAIGHLLEWESTDEWQEVRIWRDFGDQMLTEHREEVQAWLGDVVNRFVNAFRPRIESLLRDE